MSHISRSSVTLAGEHAAKQVITLSLKGVQESELPAPELLNTTLPNSIMVFKIIVTNDDFSARRNCEARTYQYLIPTYAFSPPPEATEYCNPEMDDGIPDDVEMPKGGMFTVKNRSSLARRATFKTKTSLDETTDASTNEDKVAKDGTISCFTKFKSIFKSKKAKGELKGSEKLKASLNGTLTRKGKDDDKDETIVTTLRRSISQKRKTPQEVFADDISERERMNEAKVFEALSIPPPTLAEMDDKRAFRMTPEKYNALQSVLALFNGTHNYHNYIPGSVQDDSRCFIHVLNIDASALEVHDTMEWVRVKIVARSFGRDQIRRMMGMLIMVMRTNTPRSVLGNSFGFTKIDIPEAPQGHLILDTPHFNTFNADALTTNTPTIHFGTIPALAEFKVRICERVFKGERETMVFEGWLRGLDDYSFMYTHYLNSQGVITKPMNFPGKVVQVGSSETVDGKEE